MRREGWRRWSGSESGIVERGGVTVGELDKQLLGVGEALGKGVAGAGRF